MFYRLAMCCSAAFILIVSLCLSVAAAADTCETKSAGTAECADEVKALIQEFDKVEVQQYPWGWIRWLMSSKLDPKAEMTFGVVFVKPNQRNPVHMHPNCEECLHVLSGSCEHLLGDKWLKLKKGDTLRIPQGIRHAARTTDEACRAVIVYNTGDRQFVALDEGKE